MRSLDSAFGHRIAKLQKNQIPALSSSPSCFRQPQAERAFDLQLRFSVFGDRPGGGAKIRMSQTVLGGSVLI
jgi:hypothetical protein